MPEMTGTEADLPQAASMETIGRISRSPSAVSEEDVSFCVNFLTPPAQTPSTAVPDDEEAADDSPKTGARCESAPPSCEVPENVRSKLGRPPAAPSGFQARSTAEGSAAKGLKVRMCELETEVRELAQRLAAVQNAGELGPKVKLDEQCKSEILNSSNGLEAEVRCHAEALLMACREECQDVMTQLAQELQNEVQALNDPKHVLALIQKLEQEEVPEAMHKPVASEHDNIRQEMKSAVDGLRKDFQSNA